MTSTLDPDARTTDDATTDDGTIHAVESHFDSIFTWDYARSRPALIKLYEKAKT